MTTHSCAVPQSSLVREQANCGLKLINIFAGEVSEDSMSVLCQIEQYGSYNGVPNCKVFVENCGIYVE